MNTPRIDLTVCQGREIGEGTEHVEDRERPGYCLWCFKPMRPAAEEDCPSCSNAEPLTFGEMCAAFEEGGYKADVLRAVLIVGQVLRPRGLESVEDAAARLVSQPGTPPQVRAVALALLDDGPAHLVRALVLSVEILIRGKGLL
jgi:hypothetical protein